MNEVGWCLWSILVQFFLVQATRARRLSRTLVNIKSSQLVNGSMDSPLNRPTALHLGLVLSLVGRHMPMLSLSIFKVISKCCMAARLCSALMPSVFTSSLMFCQHKMSAL